MDRRQFLTSIGRGSILTGLAVLSGTLIYNRSGNPAECTLEFVCKECRELKGCKQPEAIIFKRKIEKNSSKK